MSSQHTPPTNCPGIPGPDCLWLQCPPALRAECRQLAALEVARANYDENREANRLRRRRAGELGPVGSYLVRRYGYAVRPMLDADDRRYW